MSEKILLIDGHSILNRAYSDQLGGIAYKCCVRIFKYYDEGAGRRKTGISGGCV